MHLPNLLSALSCGCFDRQAEPADGRKSLLVRPSVAHWPILHPRLQLAALVIAAILCLAISVAAQVGIGIGNSTGYATAPSSSLG